MKSSLSKLCATTARGSALILLCFAVLPLQGQLIYEQTFNNNTAAGWVFITDSGGTVPTARLTSGAVPAAQDPENGQAALDSPGQGWLRLASTTGNQANAAYYDFAMPSVGTRLTATFDFTMWGGSGADGIIFALSDASVAFDPGAFGGSLGYAQRTGINGMAGGYVGLGLDVWGNFSNNQEGRNGGPTTLLIPNEVAVRGADTSVARDGTSGFAYVAGTLDAGSNLEAIVAGTNDNLGFTSATQRPDQDALEYRKAQLVVDENGNITARVQFGYDTNGDGNPDNDYVTLFTGTLPGVRPDTLRFSFTAGTGGQNQVHEIRNFSIVTENTAASNGFYWDDDAAQSPGLWATGNNWRKTSANENVAPVARDFVYFTDLFANTDSNMTVNLNGANREIGGAVFSGQYGYTLTGDTLILDQNPDGTSGTSYITLLPNVNDQDAAHTIASAVQLDNNAFIAHYTTKAFTISGNVNLQGNNLLLKPDSTGDTLISGIVSSSSGTGTVTKQGDGKAILSGANTYTGATAVQNGTLEIRNNTALGTTAAGTTVTSGATLALSNDITVSAETLSLGGTGEGGVGALLNISGTNTYGGAVTLTAATTIASQAGSLTLNSGTALATGANNLTVNTASGSSITISSVIDDGASTAALTKTGTGTLILSANNTYDGITTVQAGTLRITNLGALGNTTGDTIVQNGATLEFANNINVPSGETITLTGDGVSGKAALWSDSGSNETDGDVVISASGASIGAAAGSTLRLDSVVSGTGTLQLKGAGTVEFAEDNSFTGNLIIGTGTDTVTARSGDAANRIVDQVAVTVNSGANWNLNNFSDTVGSLAGAGNVQLGSATLTVGANNSSTTYSGLMSGTGNLTKTGTGTFTLTGGNTFNGTLNANQGITSLGAANVLANTMTLALGGGTLQVNGFADTYGAFDLNSSSTLNYTGTSGGLLTASSVAATPTGTLTVDNWFGNAFTTSPASTTTAFFVNGASITADMTTLATNTNFTGWGTGAGWKTVTGGFELVPILTGAFRWDRDDGNWSTLAADDPNWVGDNGPNDNSPGTVVYFGDDEDPTFGIQNTADPKTVTLSGDRRVGTMILDGTNNRDYNFRASGGANRTLTFDQTGSGTAFLNVAGTENHVIGDTNTNNERVNVVLSDNTLIQNNSSAAVGLTFGTSGGDHTFEHGNSLTITGTSKTLIHSQLNGTGPIVKNGSGILELTGINNTYSGATTLNAGTLQIGSDPALGTGTLTINGGILQATGANRTVTNRNNINGSFAFIGTNTLTLNRTGDSTIGTGTHTITVSDVTGSAASDLIVGAGNDLRGAGGLIKSGLGTLEIRSDESNFSGGLTINAGTVTTGAAFDDGITIGTDVTGANYLGTGAITVNAGGTLTTTQNVAGGTDGFDFTLGGGGTLANTGGAITITNAQATDFGADLFLNGTITSSGGTTQFIDWNDMEVTGTTAINASGGTTTFRLTDDFNNATPNSNALNINVSGTGTLNVELTNAESNSTFVLGTDDTITLNGSAAAMNISTGAAANNVNLTGRVNLYDGSLLTVTQGTTTLASTLTLDGGTAPNKGTLEIRGNLVVNEPDVANSPNITINSNSATSISGTNANSSITNLGTLTKTGSGVTTIENTINNIGGERIVISGGTLLNGASDQIANETNMVLTGATYDTNGFDEVVGTLTLTATSTIDLNNSGGGGDSILRFDNSSGTTWTAAQTVSVTGWSGAVAGGGTDQLYFGNTSSGLTAGQLSQIVFVNPAGFAPGNYGALILSTGEVVPVPEPAVYVTLFLLLAYVGWRERARLKKILRLSSPVSLG